LTGVQSLSELAADIAARGAQPNHDAKLVGATSSITKR
jgi:hypothetical protein